MPTELRFPFAFDWPGRYASRPFGVTPGSAEVVVTGERLQVRFGPWRVSTTLDNVTGAEVSGPYSWWRIAGPARLSVSDRGLTFATTDRRGVCIAFRRPVPGIDALGLVRHPNLTVTVEDAPGLVEVLNHAAGAGPGTTVEEVVGEMADDLHALSARELRERARSLGITGVASMKKGELVDALSHHAAR
jgi:hypothetical protein